jgi:hypothetical protein
VLPEGVDALCLEVPPRVRILGHVTHPIHRGNVEHSGGKSEY